MMVVKLLVKIAVMMMATAAFRRHQKRRGEGAPSSSSSLTSSLDGRRVSPLVFGLHGVGEARAPLSLSVSAFLDCAPSPFLLYPEIRNYDWGESFAQIFLIKLAFLRQNMCINRLTVGPGESMSACLPGAPPISWPPQAPYRVDFTSQKS